MTALIWSDLPNDEQNALIGVALDGKRRAHHNHGKYKRLAARGLLEVASKGKVFNTYKVTALGRELLLTIPDDFGRGIFPVPADIANMKGKLNNDRT